VRARVEKPDLVVTDVAIPGLDGVGLAEALRRDERTREIPLTSSAARHRTARARHARRSSARSRT
jgi:CheY-like chemotaxis protein